MKILGLYPLHGNGGIASWSRKFIKSFPNEEFDIIAVDISPEKDFSLFRGGDRFVYGIKALRRSISEIKRTIKNHPDLQIMHITTGGGFGVIRDNVLARICRKHGIKCIMHCRFGVVKELFEGKSIISKVFRNSINSLYNQIWVLDRRSYNYLKSHDSIKNKIFLTPNSIEVPTTCDFSPKTYRHIGYVGNLLPTKGVLELVQAVAQCPKDTTLSLIGLGAEDFVNKLKETAGNRLDTNIKFLGRLPNDQAVKKMEEIDIIALPTYYSGEAFPISILEAMSRGKLVISCPRAAIPDMLTAIDGTQCGVLVAPKSSEELREAILWCQQHSKEADEMCKKAYEKVNNSYSKEVVYQIYRINYKKIL
jgi:glycosyltransferase involved in cell wall biosynthesis